MISPALLAARPAGGGGGGYTAKAVHFDGATWLRNGSLVATDSNFFSFSYWFKNSDLATANMNCGLTFVVDPEGGYTTDLDNRGVIPTPTINLGMGLLNAAGTLGVTTSIIDPNTTAPPVTDTSWHHLLFSGETGLASGSNVRSFWFDDVDMTHLDSDQGPFQMAFNGLSFWFGADNFGGGTGSGILGDVADAQIMPNTYLVSGGTIPQATRRLFISASGKPVDPATAIATLGTPAILFSGDAAGFAANQGTSGAFTLTGSLTNASTSPSD